MRLVFLEELVLLVAFLAVAVEPMPYIVLKNKAAKCYQVDAKSNTKLIVKYHAPDMVIIPDEDPEKKVEDPEKKDGELKPEEGLDARFNERFQKRMETLKRAHLKDINISITPRDAAGVMIAPRMMQQDGDAASLPKKKREQLETREGSFEYDTGNLEGSLEICIQSYTATAENPSRVAFSILPQSEEVEIEKLLQAERKLMNERLEVENKIVKEETSRITAELVRMQRRAKTIAGDAQFSKKREEEFHAQSVSLNKAVKYWPMVRMTALLVGGYLQVTHVISFMKSRHIY